MSFTLEALNAIRDESTPDYQRMVPVATQTNFRDIGQAFATYTPLYLEFADKLMVKIGLSMLRQATFENKLKRFKTGQMTSQNDVEEIFIQMAGAANKYNPAGPNPLGRRAGVAPQVVYHRLNRQDEYCETIGDIDFIRAFTSPEAADKFLRGKLSSMYMRAEYDEYLHMKNVLATYGHAPTYELTEDVALDPTKVYYTQSGINPNYVYTPVQAPVVENIGTYYEDTAFGTSHGYYDYEVPVINSEATARTWVKTMRKAAKDVGYLESKFNKAGVQDVVQPSQLVLFVNKDVSTEVDVEMLSKAFNPSKADVPISNVIELDNFGTLPDTSGLLVHEDFFRVFDTLQRMEPQRNAQGLFTNYFWHVHQILSASPFRTAIRLKTTVSGG